MRKYLKGEPIKSLDDLARQEFIFFYDRVVNYGWFQSWQFRFLSYYLKENKICYAVKKGE